MRLLNLIYGLVFILALGEQGLHQTAQAAQSDVDNSIELVDPKVMRVCADPANMPLSDEKGEGYENKIAELLAEKLGKSLAYTWYPNSTGFIRMTLMSYKCDVVMGFPQGDDLVQPTNPYFRTAYALIFKPGTGLDGITSLEDPRLKSKHIGLIAGTPPATPLAVNGLMGNVKPYQLVVDSRYHSSTQAMVADVESGAIDVGVLWGPIAGYFAQQGKPPLTLTPLLQEKSNVPMTYRMVMGVRASDQDWKRLLNTKLAENKAAINQILLQYGVPLLDEKNHAITK